MVWLTFIFLKSQSILSLKTVRDLYFFFLGLNCRRLPKVLHVVSSSEPNLVDSVNAQVFEVSIRSSKQVFTLLCLFDLYAFSSDVAQSHLSMSSVILQFCLEKENKNARTYNTFHQLRENWKYFASHVQNSTFSCKNVVVLKQILKQNYRITTLWKTFYFCYNW